MPVILADVIPPGAVAKRDSAFLRMKDKGFLASFELATITADKITAREVVRTYALDNGRKSMPQPDGRLKEMQVYFVAGLQEDGVTPLVLRSAQDRMYVDGEPIAIANPGPIRPQGVTLLFKLTLSTEFL